MPGSMLKDRTGMPSLGAAAGHRAAGVLAPKLILRAILSLKASFFRGRIPLNLQP